VLIALFERDGAWWLPLTVRHAGMSRHQGQISLPGGLIEPGEASEIAAVREFGEELGPTPIEILGSLNDCYVYVSDTVATPWVGVIQRVDEWQPNPREVERVIEFPIELLSDLTSRDAITIRRGPLQFEAPGFAIGEDHVWGATAVMLEQLSRLISLERKT
jgi:8-oxo-dGTP pyrophosphatase MutT (NUDIX family)